MGYAETQSSMRAEVPVPAAQVGHRSAVVAFIQVAVGAGGGLGQSIAGFVGAAPSLPCSQPVLCCTPQAFTVSFCTTWLSGAALAFLVPLHALRGRHSSAERWTATFLLMHCARMPSYAALACFNTAAEAIDDSTPFYLCRAVRGVAAAVCHRRGADAVAGAADAADRGGAAAGRYGSCAAGARKLASRLQEA